MVWTDAEAAARCDECGAATEAGVSPQHGPACSLHPDNCVGALSGAADLRARLIGVWGDCEDFPQARPIGLPNTADLTGGHRHPENLSGGARLDE